MNTNSVDQPGLDRDTLTAIVTRAVHAPSGDNSQPWQFCITDDSIDVFNVPNADATLYDFKSRGSYLSHGAVIENIAVAAAARGYHAHVELFPGAQNQTAHITFSRGQVADAPLAAVIEQRASNRKPYANTPLTSEQRTALVSAVASDTELRMCEEPGTITALAEAVSTNERLLMEHRGLHDGLFGMIRWSRRHEDEKPGLYVKTMEFPLPVEFMFRRVLVHWSAVLFLNRLVGFSRSIPKQSAAGYQSCAAMGAVIVPGVTDADFVQAGRAVERIWLQATALGLSMQPVTAIPYLAQRITEEGDATFTSEQQALIRAANETITKAFHVTDNERIAMLFRIGVGNAPTATSAKRAPVILTS